MQTFYDKRILFWLVYLKADKIAKAYWKRTRKFNCKNIYNFSYILAIITY